MPGPLADKTAFVTAAGQGIGRATALAFAAAGARVIATDIDAAKVQAIASDRITAARLDVLRADDIAQAARDAGAIDILFNCAGLVHQGTLLEAKEDEWALAFDLNVRSMFRTMQAFVPGMVARGSGVILNMASVSSSLKGVPNRFIYSATKAAVIGMTRSVATDYIRHGIRCNCLCPGTVLTPSLEERIEANAAQAGSVQAARQAFVDRQPMGRLGSPEEIAAACGVSRIRRRTVHHRPGRRDRRRAHAVREDRHMKLLRYGPFGAERPALLAEDGTIRCLSSVVRDIDGFALSGPALKMIAGIDPMTLPKVDASVRLGSCVARPVNYVCIGLNYADHAAEAGMPVPKEPIIFLKSLGALCGPNDDVKLPRGSKKLDWEVELGIVIGKTARYVPEHEAMDYVAGYCVCNDVSEREFQIERAGTWDKGKGCDTFGPTGPWVVTKDEIPDPQALPLWTEVNGKRMQNGTTKTMIFGVVKLVSYVSHFITLHAGDVIATGTPPGVGQGVKPNPVFLKIGDTMRLSVEGLGVQTQRVVEG